MPNLLVKAGINDPRVQYWEPAKYVAKIRDLQAKMPNKDQSLILFDCKMGSGHFGSSGRCIITSNILDAYWEETSGDYAFAIDQLLNNKL